MKRETNAQDRMKRTLALLALLSLVSVSAVHCKKKEVPDAGAEPEPSSEPTTEPTTEPSTPPPSTPLASNSEDVARFGEETKLANVHALVVLAANARESPPNGPVVTPLPKGTEVTEIAQRDAYILAVFANPKNTSESLMGWIFAPSLGGAAVAPAVVVPTIKTDGGAVVRVDASVPVPVPPTSCPAGLTLVMVDLPVCAKICAEDKECPTGQACKGSANKIVNGKAGDGVTTCVVYHPHVAHDAGAPATVKDASAPAVTVDASVAPAATGPEVAPTAGKCPATYVLVAKDGKCHKDCTASAAVCGSARCTKKCGTTQSVCLVNAATCP